MATMIHLDGSIPPFLALKCMNEDNIDTNPVTMNLLFVDDEVNILKALRRLFRGAEYNVQTAESGAEGLAILEQTPIDLVISDMRMPQMNGAEFLTHVAERWPETVRVLLTGYADIDSTVAAVNKGRIYCYISKPWEDNELKILVNNAIDQKRLREERQRLFAIIERQNAELKDLNSHLEDKVERRTEQLRLSLQKIDQAHTLLKKQYIDSVKVFAKIVEMRPGIKSGHSLYIAENAHEVALRMGLDADEARDVLYAGLLLQIGKMSLSEDMLRQPLHLMSSHDKKLYLQHGLEGWKLLHGIAPLKNAAELILHQYEHYDGTGDPHSLAAAEIPLGSRILAVVRDYIDYLDGQMTGATMSVHEAASRLQLHKEHEYDPHVVDYFLAYLAENSVADDRPIIEISWNQLRPGMEAAEILYDGVLYLKDTVLTIEQVSTILHMREQRKNIVLRVRV